MTLVIHISDLHFGRADPVIAEALLDEINALQPSLVAIAGDITHRARRVHFKAARDWLDRIVPPVLVVPGSHDIPLYDVMRRFAAPRERYMHYISSDLAPCFIDDEIAVCGIDSTTNLALKAGQITREQAERVAALLAPQGNLWRIVVVHHPLERVSGRADTVQLLEATGVDLVLAGYTHVPKLVNVPMLDPAHAMLAVHPGTCMSTRLRGAPNGYNQLHITGDSVRIVHRVWRDARFADGAENTHRRRERGSVAKEPLRSRLEFPHLFRYLS